MPLLFGIIFIVLVIGVGSALIFPLVLSGRAITKFSKTINKPLQKNPDTSFLPQVFVAARGNVFQKVGNLITIDQSFFIFTNTQWYGRQAAGQNSLQKQLCFLFTIKPLTGRHKLILNNINLENRLIGSLVGMSGISAATPPN